MLDGFVQGSSSVAGLVHTEIPSQIQHGHSSQPRAASSRAATQPKPIYWVSVWFSIPPRAPKPCAHWHRVPLPWQHIRHQRSQQSWKGTFPPNPFHGMPMGFYSLGSITGFYRNCLFSVCPPWQAETWFLFPDKNKGAKGASDLSSNPFFPRSHFAFPAAELADLRVRCVGWDGVAGGTELPCRMGMYGPISQLPSCFAGSLVFLGMWNLLSSQQILLVYNPRQITTRTQGNK